MADNTATLILKRLEEAKEERCTIRILLDDLRLHVVKQNGKLARMDERTTENRARIREAEDELQAQGKSLVRMSGMRSDVNWLRDKFWQLTAFGTGVGVVGALIGKFIL